MGRMRSRGKVKHVKQRSTWRKFITAAVVLNLLGTAALILKEFSVL